MIINCVALVCIAAYLVSFAFVHITSDDFGDRMEQFFVTLRWGAVLGTISTLLVLAGSWAAHSETRLVIGQSTEEVKDGK